MAAAAPAGGADAMTKEQRAEQLKRIQEMVNAKNALRHREAAAEAAKANQLRAVIARDAPLVALKWWWDEVVAAVLGPPQQQGRRKRAVHSVSLAACLHGTAECFTSKVQKSAPFSTLFPKPPACLQLKR